MYADKLKYLLNFFSLLFCAVLVAGCVQTMGSASKKTAQYLQQTELPAVTDRHSQLIHQTLVSLIGGAEAEMRYQLDYSLTQATRTALSSAGQESQLNSTTMAVNFTLTDKQTGEILTSGTASASATSGTINSLYGQAVSERFAGERLVKLLAERMHQKLQLYFLSVEG